MTDLRDQLADPTVIQLPRTGHGSLLRRLRTTAGLTLDDIGQRCHITRKGMCNRELKGVALPAAALIEHLDALGYDVIAIKRDGDMERRTA